MTKSKAIIIHPPRAPPIPAPSATGSNLLLLDLDVFSAGVLSAVDVGPERGGVLPGEPESRLAVGEDSAVAPIPESAIVGAVCSKS